MVWTHTLLLKFKRWIISYTDIIVRSTCRGHFLRFEVQLARWKMNILPSAATLGLSADEFLPHNPCLSLWSSEGIVFVYSQAFFHQEHSRQCGEKEKEEETGRERWKNQELFEEWSKNEKLLCKCFNPARPVGVCVCVAHLLLMWNVNQTITFQDLNQPAVSKGAD